MIRRGRSSNHNRSVSPAKAIRDTIRSGSQAFLSCEIGDGMFKGEKIVALSVSGEFFSVIVSENSVREGKLVVDVYEKKGNQFLIGLPGESFSTARSIWVPQEQLIK